MRVAPRKILLLAVCLLVSSFASAEVITFNSLPGNGTPIPDGFAGLDWNNFYDMNRNVLLTPGSEIPLAGGVPPASGAFAYNNAGAPATFSASNTFTFSSAWLATMGASPMTLEVVGLLGGKAVDSIMLVLSSPVPTQEAFNWSGIDGVRFVPQTSANSNGKLQFALSEIVINSPAVPEPPSMLLLGSGVGLVISRLRRLRQAK
jgi:hypothetical protein